VEKPAAPASTPGAFWVYLAIAAIGLVGTAWFNVQSVVNPSGETFFAAWFANPSVSSLSWDLLATASAASVLIILEGRRLGIRWYWAYVVFSFVTAVAFTFPLFLAMRERRLAQLDAAAADARAA
jgi:hypothetical protein